MIKIIEQLSQAIIHQKSSQNQKPNQIRPIQIAFVNNVTSAADRCR